MKSLAVNIALMLTLIFIAFTGCSVNEQNGVSEEITIFERITLDTVVLSDTAMIDHTDSSYTLVIQTEMIKIDSVVVMVDSLAKGEILSSDKYSIYDTTALQKAPQIDSLNVIITRMSPQLKVGLSWTYQINSGFSTEPIDNEDDYGIKDTVCYTITSLDTLDNNIIITYSNGEVQTIQRYLNLLSSPDKICTEISPNTGARYPLSCEYVHSPENYKMENVHLKMYRDTTQRWCNSYLSVDGHNFLLELHKQNEGLATYKEGTGNDTVYEQNLLNLTVRGKEEKVTILEQISLDTIMLSDTVIADQTDSSYSLIINNPTIKIDSLIKKVDSLNMGVVFATYRDTLYDTAVIQGGLQTDTIPVIIAKICPPLKAGMSWTYEIRNSFFGSYNGKSTVKKDTVTYTVASLDTTIDNIRVTYYGGKVQIIKRHFKMFPYPEIMRNGSPLSYEYIHYPRNTGGANTRLFKDSDQQWCYSYFSGSMDQSVSEEYHESKGFVRYNEHKGLKNRKDFSQTLLDFSYKDQVVTRLKETRLETYTSQKTKYVHKYGNSYDAILSQFSIEIDSVVRMIDSYNEGILVKSVIDTIIDTTVINIPYDTLKAKATDFTSELKPGMSWTYETKYSDSMGNIQSRDTIKYQIAAVDTLEDKIAISYGNGEMQVIDINLSFFSAKADFRFIPDRPYEIGPRFPLICTRLFHDLYDSYNDANGPEYIEVYQDKDEKLSIYYSTFFEPGYTVLFTENIGLSKYTFEDANDGTTLEQSLLEYSFNN